MGLPETSSIPSFWIRSMTPCRWDWPRTGPVSTVRPPIRSSRMPSNSRPKRSPISPRSTNSYVTVRGTLPPSWGAAPKFTWVSARARSTTSGREDTPSLRYSDFTWLLALLHEHVEQAREHDLRQRRRRGGLGRDPEPGALAAERLEHVRPQQQRRLAEPCWAGDEA